MASKVAQQDAQLFSPANMTFAHVGDHNESLPTVNGFELVERRR